MEHLAKIFRPITIPQQIEEILKEFKDLHKKSESNELINSAKKALEEILVESIKENLAGRIGDATIPELLDLHKQIGLINKTPPINNNHPQQDKHGRRTKG